MMLQLHGSVIRGFPEISYNKEVTITRTMRLVGSKIGFPF